MALDHYTFVHLNTFTLAFNNLNMYAYSVPRTKIGQIRGERDLLEAIIFPSASFVRSFEPVIVSTKDGEEYSGILRRDSADELVLATGPGAEVHVARADLAEMRPGKLSVMPQGLDEQLTRQELADLVAFLKATRW